MLYCTRLENVGAVKILTPISAALATNMNLFRFTLWVICSGGAQ